MERNSLILWILAYTITGADMLLGMICFLQTRRSEVSAFLLLLMNIMLITLMSVSFSISLMTMETFNILLFNCLLLLYVTAPNLLYKIYGFPFPLLRFLMLYGVAAAAANGLYLLEVKVVPAVYFVFWIPFVFTGFFLRKRISTAEGENGEPETLFRFYRSLKSTWYVTGLIAVLMTVCSVVFVLSKGTSKGAAFSIFFALFYCLYCLPSLIYFIYYHITSNRNRPDRQHESDEMFDELSLREKEVAELIMQGKKYREIGEELFISLSTVKKHANNIYRKTGTANGRQLIREAVKRKRRGPSPLSY